jgi:intracellular sulfur oxidation DsrE/DsrF family protein
MATKWGHGPRLQLAAGTMLAIMAAIAPGPTGGKAWAQGTDRTAAKVHKVAIQVSENDKAQMDLALNNAKNIVDYYKKKGETVLVEIVTYGPGLHMLRADTSPVKDRIGPMVLENPEVKLIACGNTQANQSKAEGKAVTLIPEATVMPSGAVRLMELQAEGYAYLRP